MYYSTPPSPHVPNIICPILFFYILYDSAPIHLTNCNDKSPILLFVKRATFISLPIYIAMSFYIKSTNIISGLSLRLLKKAVPVVA